MIRRPRSFRDQAGFTLVELVVVVVLLGVVGGPLIESLIEALRTTGAASNSLGNSHDVQLADYYLERDAVGATPLTGGATPTNPAADWTCAQAAGLTAVQVATQGVLEFKWAQAPSATGGTDSAGNPAFNAGQSYEADYVYSAPSLIRYFCTFSGGTTLSTQQVRVASTLSQTKTPTASVSTTCVPKQSLTTCTSVTLTDPNGQTYTVVLYERNAS